ncbi:MAG: phosphoribosyltransferase [Symploca sp. SIO1B1]|nr:phosphoribosyltransferase [Symploca sp. SIO1B1]
MPDLHLSWSEYHQKIEALATKIYQAHWEFDQIVCLAKGGLRVGDILCRIYGKPLAILSASSYGGAENKVRASIKFATHLTMTTEQLGSRILLVDDLVDSGISLQEAIKWLQQYHGEVIEEIRTGVIWYKGNSIFIPDYYVDYLPDNPWIYQPFEHYEKINPAELGQVVGLQPKKKLNTKQG